MVWRVRQQSDGDGVWCGELDNNLMAVVYMWRVRQQSDGGGGVCCGELDNNLML